MTAVLFSELPPTRGELQTWRLDREHMTVREDTQPLMTVSVPLLHDVHARIDLTATYDREADAITVHVVDDQRVQLIERFESGSLVKRAIAAERDASASRSAADRLSVEVTRMRRAEAEHEAREYAATWHERWEL